MTLRSFFSVFIPPSIPQHSDKEKKKLLKKAVSKTATGNVLLQLGRYLTSKDIAELKEKALGHKN